MDVERLLVSTAVRDGTLERVISRGIEPAHFVSRAVGAEPATADVLAWSLAHLRRYKLAPSEFLFRRRWPGFVFLESSDPFDAVLDEFVKVVKRRKLIEQIRHLSEVADDWSAVADAEVHMMEAASELARLVPTGETSLYSDSFDRLAAHRQRQETGIEPGVSFLIPELDDFTYGVQRHELAVIEGSTSIGKSTLSVGMAAKAYFEKKQTPMFLSFEMEGEFLQNRWDAFAAGISYRALERCELEPEDYDKWAHVAEKAADAKMERDIVVIDDMRHPTIERVLAEVERWRPDFVVADPIDEIAAPANYRNSYERQGYVAQELKAIARSRKVPFIVPAQSGRDAEAEGATLGNIADSFKIVRKADIVIGLHASEQMQGMNKLEFRLLKNRRDAGKGFRVAYRFDPAKVEYEPWRPEFAAPVREAEPVA